ncbi:MAG TPA: ATP-binding cassette domain-containing protein, partial [Pyrinomonadaceae bacterium]|nr:ATP-binding cassette domain-containing protein [Pyrinomonadaceae bacterium]
MILELKNITHGFSAAKKILDAVSLELEKGKIYALMGANGSGKTTLFNVITGFIKPQSGDIFFKSNRINRLPPHKINRLGIGRTFQDLRLISKLTVKENVILAMNGNPTQSWYRAALPKTFYKTGLDSLAEKAEEIIAECFLPDVRDSLAGEISYGQQKLLNLACCIANDAELFLLDEPVAGINPRYREQILDLLQRLKAREKTIFLIEHNTEFLQQTADRIFFLKNGSIMSYDTFVHLREDKEV